MLGGCFLRVHCPLLLEQSVNLAQQGGVDSGCIAKVHYEANASDPPRANGGRFTGTMSVFSSQMKKGTEIQLAWTFWDGSQLGSNLDFDERGIHINHTLDELKRQNVVMTFPADADRQGAVKFLESLDNLGKTKCDVGLPLDVKMRGLQCILQPEHADPGAACEMKGMYCCRAGQKSQTLSTDGASRDNSPKQRHKFAPMKQPSFWMVTTGVAFGVIVILLIGILKSKLLQVCEDANLPSGDGMVSIEVLSSARDPPACTATKLFCGSKTVGNLEAKPNLATNSQVPRSEQKWDSLCWGQHMPKALGRSISKTIYMSRSSGNIVGGANNTMALRSPRLDDLVQVDIMNQVIGTGAFSVVRVGVLRSPEYKAKYVAVKLVEPSLFSHMDTTRSSQAIKAIEKELKIFQGMKLHKNVVRYYDGAFNEPKKEVYVVEELMNGNLNGLIHDPKHMAKCTFSHMLAIFSDIVAGLLHLHSWNTIHHDLKPANVLLDKSLRHAKLSDFGCSRMKTKSVLTARLVGTLGYLPVECIVPYFRLQVRAKSIDVFSMGVVMWESITGQRPPNPYAAHYTAVTASVCTGSEVNSSLRSEALTYVDPSERYPIGNSCPNELKQLIWECLSFSFKRRPPMGSVSDRVQELQHRPWVKLPVRPAAQ